ncbi:helix-turn-helix transcriptional regulator [Caballeronia sp. LZ001]|uniref:helix-turn-helix domain-containing protein n=1 Tax=Caballeronia sp. LZ001 TaxID=3038553 RepID=UPI002858A689|nr:helix-turn-helix transcriptional regulator [Caballeronia sp. LZ001]MDR5801156.1 helix-turn-helix transcriptional regulator [Caballeronia sp. LZ001]
MNLSDMVRNRREALGMTLEEVADAAGSSKSHIWSIENDRTQNVSLHMATRLSVALGLSIHLMAAATLECKGASK